HRIAMMNVPVATTPDVSEDARTHIPCRDCRYLHRYRLVRGLHGVDHATAVAPQKPRHPDVRGGAHLFALAGSPGFGWPCGLNKSVIGLAFDRQCPLPGGQQRTRTRQKVPSSIRFAAGLSGSGNVGSAMRAGQYPSKKPRGTIRTDPPTPAALPGS